MYRYYGIVRGFTGPGLASTGATVYDNAAGTSAASLYDSAGAGIANPTTTNARGAIDVYSPLSRLWYKVAGDTVVQPLPRIAAGGAVFDALDFGAVGDGTTDDTAELNAMLAGVGTNGGRCFVPDGNYIITDPLVIRSHTHLDLSAGATITLKAASACNLLQNAGVTANRSVADAGISDTDKTLTSASASFVAADVGRTVIVAGAGHDGIPLVATIASRTSGTEVELDTAAGTTVANAACSIHARDSHILVTGGTWDRLDNEGTGIAKHIMLFRHLDGVTVRDVAFASTGGKYAVSFGSVSDFHTHDLRFNTKSDGVHVAGPAHDGTISDLYGDTGDDVAAITPVDYSTYLDVAGDVSNVTICRIYADSVAGGAAKVLGGHGVDCRHVSVHDIFGTGANPSVYIGDDSSEAGLVGGALTCVTVENVYATPSGAGDPAVYIKASNGGDFTVRNVTLNSAYQANGAVYVATGSSLASLLIDGIDVVATAASSMAVVIDGAVVNLTARNINLQGLGASSDVIQLWDEGVVTNMVVDGVTGTQVGYIIHMTNAAAVITRCAISNIATSGGGGLWKSHIAGTTMPDVTVTNVNTNAPSWALCDSILTQNIYCSGVRCIAPAAGIINARAGSVLVVTAHCCEFGNTGCTIAATGVIASRSFGFRTDVGQANFGKNANDMAYNTNAARACGAGPVVCNGTSWKHLYTGTEYTP